VVREVGVLLTPAKGPIFMPEFALRAKVISRLLGEI
jgi:hypothetical protein